MTHCRQFGVKACQRKTSPSCIMQYGVQVYRHFYWALKTCLKMLSNERGACLGLRYWDKMGPPYTQAYAQFESQECGFHIL